MGESPFLSMYFYQGSNVDLSNNAIRKNKSLFLILIRKLVSLLDKFKSNKQVSLIEHRFRNQAQAP
jgi:hypothetical protein